MPVTLIDTITGKYGEKTYIFRSRTGETIGISVREEGGQPGEKRGLYRGEERLCDVRGDPEYCASICAGGLIGLGATVVGAYMDSHVAAGVCGRPWEYQLPSGIPDDDPDVSGAVAFLRGDPNVTVDVKGGKIVVTRKHGM